MNKKFVLLGMGYVSEKHLKAIKDVGGELLAFCDTKHDVVGKIDSYFPEAKFFTDFERLDRYCSKFIDDGNTIDYVSICSPNYLHDAHCRFALRIGANAICEKPLVLYTRNLKHLENLEKKTGKRIFTILQLRLNPVVQELKRKIEAESSLKERHVSLIYHTYRGDWYLRSWKSDIDKSGGLFTNIGIHLADVLIYLFGNNFSGIQIYKNEQTNIEGKIDIDNTTIYFDLSTKEKKTRRDIIIDGVSTELSDGFLNAHTKSYENIMIGNGFGIKDVRDSIKLCEEVRKLCRREL